MFADNKTYPVLARTIELLEERFPGMMLRLKPLRDFMGKAGDRRYYDFFFRRSVFTAVLLLILAFPISELFKDDPLVDTDAYGSQNVKKISSNTLIVLNAVPRTSLAQKRVKVPIIREVEVALEEIDMPKPQFGAIEIGEEQAESGGGEGTPTGKLPYRRPELMMLVPPVYPKDAEKNGIEGTVGLRVLVTDKGTVDRVEVESSSGHTQMDDAAVKAARKTRFRPAIKDGERVAMWINYPIQFALSKRKND
ncbi:energy transducer TonB [Gemmatimonadota bacterium]